MYTVHQFIPSKMRGWGGGGGMLRNNVTLITAAGSFLYLILYNDVHRFPGPRLKLKYPLSPPSCPLLPDHKINIK
jgi:hypothetical protein